MSADKKKKTKKITLKHGKTRHKNVQILPEDTFEDFQARVFSLTSVPLDRQKLICKGKRIEDTESLQKVKSKSIVLLMGSAIEVATAVKGDGKVFVEDMSDAQRLAHNAELPPGLHNLGNTCYLNSTLQCLKHVPQLDAAVKRQAQIARATGATETMTAQLGQLFLDMDTVSDAVVPRDFVNYFRGNFPQFAERTERGVWAQQDADEALVQILAAIKREGNAASSAASGSASGAAATASSGGASSSPANAVDSIFGGEFEIETKCKESDLEEVRMTKENFLKIRCFIDGDTRHVNTGVLKDLEGEVEKRSEVLQRNAIFTTTRRISKLPKFLNIQLVRFYWKQAKQTYAKVLKKVVFPPKLDVYEFCTSDLKAEIGAQRRAQLEKEDAEREAKDKAERERDAEMAKEAGGDGGDGGADKGKGKEKEEEKKMDVDEKKDDKMDVDWDPATAIKGDTGFYDLVALVTHKGLSPKSGHYIGYAKDPKLGWLKFDDETTTECTEEDIAKLYGGGQWQMGYHVFYQRRDHK